MIKKAGALAPAFFVHIFIRKKINYKVSNDKLNKYSVVIDLPHSGIIIPHKIKANLLKDALLPNTDWFLPKLYSFLPQMGFTVLENILSRYVVDPNRDVS